MELAARTLTHAQVRLEPFEERHREGLTAAAADPSIWKHMPWPVVQQGYGVAFEHLRKEQAEGRWLPHAVIAPNGVIVGQSCYLSIRKRDDGVEVGGTWYAPSVQGTAINPAAKLLLFGNAFDSGVERIELKTDANNARSRAAMLKLGCVFEGIFRHHMRRPDGTWRDSAYFSVLKSEWPAMKARLDERLAQFPVP